MHIIFMSINIYSDFTDNNSLETEKLERYSNFFQKQLINYSNLNLDPESIIEQLYENLNEQNHKGMRLVELAEYFRGLYETCMKTIKKLESYKESAEYKFEGLEKQIEDANENLFIKEKKIEELTTDLDEIEKKFYEALLEKENQQKEISQLKKNYKLRESEIDELLASERKKFMKEKENDFTKIECSRIEIKKQERNLEDYKTAFNKLQNQ